MRKIVALCGIVFCAVCAEAQDAQINPAEIVHAIEAATGWTADELANGHVLYSVTVDGGGTDVKVYENALTPSAAVIHDANGNDVTENYNISYKKGNLEIYAKADGIIPARLDITL